MIKNSKKVVFIGHPVSGDIQENIKKILDICKKFHNKNIIPCAPYLVSLKYLNDEIIEDRELGIEANLECFHRKFIGAVAECLFVLNSHISVKFSKKFFGLA
ncbi:MAG: hypothetical protein V1698_02585 [bacterium]